jgi:hypothetical protein
MENEKSTDDQESVSKIYYGEDSVTHELTLVKENDQTGERSALSLEEQDEHWRHALEWQESQCSEDYKPTWRYLFQGQNVSIITIDECLPDGTEDIFEEDAAEPKPVAGFNYRRDVYYDSARKSYLMKDSSGAWLAVMESMVKRRLKINFKSPSDTNWSADYYLDEIFTKQSINFAGNVAGYKVGRS